MQLGENFGGFLFSSQEQPQHPQYNILKKHIERCVQDMFLEAIRTQPPELLFVFETEEQIDLFIKKILNYWEDLENFEICQEVINQEKIFKEKWLKRSEIDISSYTLKMLDIFGTSEK